MPWVVRQGHCPTRASAKRIEVLLVLRGKPITLKRRQLKRHDTTYAPHTTTGKLQVLPDSRFGEGPLGVRKDWRG